MLWVHGNHKILTRKMARYLLAMWNPGVCTFSKKKVRMFSDVVAWLRHVMMSLCSGPSFFTLFAQHASNLRVEFKKGLKF